MNRRDFLKLGVLGSGLLPLGFGNQFAFADLAKLGSGAKNLVFVFLYGGADPLDFFPPTEDDAYYSQRPNVAFKKADTLPFHDLFRLNKALGVLDPIWKDGEMAVIHQFGLPEAMRSHSLAQKLVATGVGTGKVPFADGFLSRALVERFGTELEPLRSVALQPTVPKFLEGQSGAVCLSSIDELRTHSKSALDVYETLSLYENSSDPLLREQGRLAKAMVEKIRRVFGTLSTKTKGAKEERAEIGYQLKEVARLINAPAGLRLAFTSSLEWDPHLDQINRMLPKMQSLSDALAAFRTDLKKTGRWDDTIVIVTTEFGRAVKENGAHASEHGHGSAAILLGGALKQSVGGKVLHKWTSLKDADLSEGRDLHVHHDYRNVLSELLISQIDLPKEKLGAVFPGHEYKKIGLLA